MEIYGSQEKAIDSIKLSDGLEERNTGVIVYTTTAETLEEVLSAAPKLGTQNDNFPKKMGMILQKRDVQSAGANVWTVTLTYYKTEAETVDDENKQEPTYDLKYQEGATSILLHPEFKKASSDAKTIAKALIDGTDPYEKVYYRVTGGVLEIEKENPGTGGWTESTLAKMADKIAGTDEIGKTLLEKVRDGWRDYKITAYIWKETIHAKSISNYAKGAGRIDIPPGPNPNINGNWLYKGVVSATKTRSDKLWKIDREWESSSEGEEWDKDIYGAGGGE